MEKVEITKDEASDIMKVIDIALRAKGHTAVPYWNYFAEKFTPLFGDKPTPKQSD